MRIRLPNVFLIIDVVVLLLVASISFIPSSGLRVVLALPFLLLFPGYVLVAALFPAKDEMDGLERLALSFGMSIPAVALIGLGLNYTPWGIRLQPVLYSISAFILVLSVIAMWRRWKLNRKSEMVINVHLRLPGWEGSTLNKTLSVVLMVSILGTVGVLGYAVAKPKVGERFTEFYILGAGGKAQDYPSRFVLADGRAVRVTYGAGLEDVSGDRGNVTVGIINHEHRDTAYSLRVTVAGEPGAVIPDGTSYYAFGPVTLGHEEKLEQVVGMAPRHAGEDQKAEFLLYKDGDSEPYLTLHLWVDAAVE